MIKYIGQRIFSFITKFRNDVYLKSISASASTTAIVKDTDGKLGLYGNFQNRGHHGYVDFIQIIPSNFMVNEEDTDAGSFVIYDDSARGVTTLGDGNDLWAFVSLPWRSIATALTIYGSDTSAVTCYKSFFTKNTADASLGTGNVNTTINITDIAAATSAEFGNVDAANGWCIGIKIVPANADTRIYGGLLTISVE